MLTVNAFCSNICYSNWRCLSLTKSHQRFILVTRITTKSFEMLCKIIHRNVIIGSRERKPGSKERTGGRKGGKSKGLS